MRTMFLLILTIIFVSDLNGQTDQDHSSYELLGSLSYEYSKTTSRFFDTGEPYDDIIHSIIVQPTLGYFLSKQFELLFDLRYNYSYRDEDYVEFHQKFWSHQIGFRIGAAYNIDVNPFISAFLGSKIGMGWSRNLSGSYRIDYDSHWGRAEVSFPVIFAGGRFFVTKSWAFIAQIEYAKTNNYKDDPYWTRENSAVILGLGFSVFL